MGILQLPGLAQTTQAQSSLSTVDPKFAPFLPQHLVNFAIDETDIVSRTKLTRIGTVFAKTAGPMGVGLKFGDTGGSNQLTSPIVGESVSSTTMVWVGQLTDANGAILVRDHTTTGGSIPIWNSGNQFRVRIGGTDYTAAGTWPYLKDQIIVLTLSATSVKLWANGVLILSLGAPGASAFVGPWHLHENGTNGTGGDATTRMWAVFAKPFPDDIAKSVSSNPWQILKSPQRVMTLGGAVVAAWASDAVGSASAASTLTTQKPLAASATATNTASAALTTGVALSAAATAASTASTTLTTQKPLAAAAIGVATAAATLTTQVALSANAVSLDAASAGITTQIPLAADARAISTASATLTVGAVWVAGATATSTASAALTTGIALSASAQGGSTASAALTTGVALSASAQAISTAASGLSTAIVLASAPQGTASASAALTVGGGWAASAISTARASASLTNAIALQAVARAQSSAVATLAVGIPPAFGPLSITRTMIFTAIRSFLVELATPQRVIRSPVNRAAMPVGPFVLVTPLATIPLATPTVKIDGAGNRSVKRSSQFNCQIDCYGPDSGDLAELISMLFREQYAVEKFAASGLEIAPLYATNAHQMPIVTGEEQYLERWTFEIALQFNPIVSTVQQSANMLSVGIISVDEAYPPQS